MITNGLGYIGALLTQGMWTRSFEEQIQDIIDELREPLDLARLIIIESMLNNLCSHIVNTIGTKEELCHIVDTYQPPIDDLRTRIRRLEEECEAIDRILLEKS